MLGYAKFMLIAVLILAAIPIAYSSQDTCQSAQYFDHQTETPTQAIAQGEEQWWKTDIDDIGKLTVYLTGPANTDFDIFVYDSCPTEETSCYSNGYSSAESCYFYTYTPKRYYLQVTSYRGTGNYQLEAAFRKNIGVCGDSYCNTGETTASCPQDCGKKHSYNQFPNGWSAMISETYHSQLYFGRQYELPLLYKCTSAGQAYLPLILENTQEQNSIEASSFDSNQKLTCGDPANDPNCRNKALAKLYMSQTDCDGQYKERKVNFTIPADGREGQYYLAAEYWIGYEENGIPKIDITDGGYNSSSASKLVTISHYRCTSNSQCAYSEYCSSGTCQQDVCAYQGQNYCENNNVYSCSSDGSTKTLMQACTSSQICSAAACTNQTSCGNNQCETGENSQNCPADCKSQCIDYCTAQTSNYNGTYKNSRCSYQTKSCTDGCFNGKCLEPDESPFSINTEQQPQGTTIYKQNRDYTSITIDSTRNQTINLSLPPELTLASGQYANGKANLTAGKNQIKLRINSNENNTVKYTVTASNGKINTTAEFYMLQGPSFIIITDSQALKQRYPNQNDKISSIMQEAYALASRKNGIVYDLASYKDILGGRPWGSFNDYKEKPVSPYMKNNSYASNAADFIQQKCGACKNALIIGDDFVVPMHRIDYNQFTGINIPMTNWWLNKTSNTRYIYTDKPYVPTTAKSVKDSYTVFGNLRQDKGDKAYFIVPNSYNTSNLNQLKAVLETKNSIKTQNIIIRESKDIDCKISLKGTVIIIGNRQNNNATKCSAWFDVGKKPGDNFNASIIIERNVWSDKSDYAFILSNERAITAFTDMLTHPLYYSNMDSKALYIRDFSNPPEIITDWEHFRGFMLGQCEYTGDTFEEQAACTASDVTISLLPGVGALTDARDATIYCYLATTQKEGLDIMLCGGSAAGTAASIGTAVTLPTVVGAAGSEAADALLSVSKGIMKALRSAVKRGPGIEKLARVIRISDAERIKTFFKVSSTGNPTEELNIALRKMDAAVSTPSKRFALNTLSQLDEDALKAGIKNIDEMDDAIKGTETILKRYKTLDEFAPELKQCIRASSMSAASVCSPENHKKLVEYLKVIGRDFNKITAKYGDEIADITLKGIKNNIIDPTKVEPEKLARYIKGAGKDVISDSGSEGLVKMFKSSGRKTISGSEEITDTLVLKKGDSAFGLAHITSGHTEDFQKHFGVSNSEDIKKIIEDTVDGGVPGISNEPGLKEVIEKTIIYNGRTARVRVVFDIKNYPGSIVTAFPLE